MFWLINHYPNDICNFSSQWRALDKYVMHEICISKNIIPVSETSSYSPISSGSPTSVCNSSGDFLIANSYQQSSIFKGNLISESFSFWSLRQKICQTIMLNFLLKFTEKSRLVLSLAHCLRRWPK